ncbi:MAG: hypothetical protein A3K76_06590 [Euryarchaeota archaeon RBG_13_57_23]|nr:MAG: hypothetical protein A3K76_06590 [Euryarchaeota archaeon RBG_13_57_23]
MAEDITQFYSSDKYLVENPSLHEEDSQWKLAKLAPLVDGFCRRQVGKEVNLLDVGGGAGIILSEVASKVRERLGISVRKYALDLSPGALQIQVARNPDIIRAVNEDIRSTSFADKEINLTLMIDVLEHVPEPERALREVARISRYLLLKVPIEDTLWTRLADAVRGAKRKQEILDSVGHVNFYTPRALRSQIERNGGRIVDFRYANSFGSLRATKLYDDLGPVQRMPFLLGPILFSVSPELCVRVFVDSALILVECQ